MMRSSPYPTWLWGFAALSGVGLVGLGLVLLLLPFIFSGALESLSVVVAGYGLISISLGAGLCVAGIRGWRHLPSPRFYARGGWLVFLFASMAVGVIAAMLPDEIRSQPLFAPFHYALIGLPGFFLLSLAAKSAGPDAAITVRRLVATLTGGAATILLAVPVELVGLMISAAVGVLVTLQLPGGEVEVERIMSLLQAWSVRPPTDQADVLGFLTSPMMVITLVLALAVITPLVEEFGKTLVMGVAGIWVKPSVLTAFIWGVACGLGFAWFEGVSNGAIGLGSAPGWLGSVAVRFLATAMHCMTSGLLGVGWGAFWRGRRWALPLAYVAAVVFHGLWNLAVILGLGGLGRMASDSLVGGMVVGAAVVLESVLVLISLVVLVGAPLLLRKRQSAI